MAKKTKVRDPKRPVNKAGETSDSNYGRKHAYLSARGLWGFDVPEPKPWRKK